jgi:CHASE2 domain-containing sensor protein
MTEFLLALAGAAVAFAALMPLLKTGGQMIAAFMRRRQVLRYCAATGAQLCALLIAALLAASVSQGSGDAAMRVLAGVLMLATVYAANYLIQRTLLQDVL